VCFYIVEGSGTFTVGDEKADLSAGEMVFAPAKNAFAPQIRGACLRMCGWVEP